MPSAAWVACADWVCPDLTPYWRLGKLQQSDKMTLVTNEGDRQFHFSLAEGYALRYFVGRYTVRQVQGYCSHEFGEQIAPNFVIALLEKLVDLGVLTTSEENAASEHFRLKATVQWIAHADGHWILRNPQDKTFMQVDACSKAVIEQLKRQSPSAVVEQFELERSELQNLLKLLKATGMLEGSSPSQSAPTKFTPLKLLSFRLPLCNPDLWLTHHIDGLRWIWSPFFGWLLAFLLSISAVFALHQKADLWFTGAQFITNLSPTISLSFIGLSLLVVTLHELGHAFTLKHYGGVVPEIGVRFTLLMPIAYTDTTDQYTLAKRRQRILVVGAGVICQVVIASIAFWVWEGAASGSWLWSAAYLVMAAATFTIAINLNPLSRFDGYYMLVALSGINNLRQRSLQFYADLLGLRRSPEKQLDRWILAIYAPLSLLYTVLVFGSLLMWLSDWILSNIPITALVVLSIWAIHSFKSSRPQTV